MAWKIEFDKRAQRDLSRLDRQIQREIVRYLEERIAPVDDPTTCGHALSADLSGVWRYRVRDYRILCRIEQDRLVILVIKVGHRSEVYDR